MPTNNPNETPLTAAQNQVDRISLELNELWRQIREKEAEMDKYNRVANPEDYQ